MQVMSSMGAMRPPLNPRTDMHNKISAAVEAGTISETDATALETALDSIDSALSSSSNSLESRLDPSEMKARVDSLIEEQVEAGTLTEEQAAELQELFAQGPSQAGSQPPEMATSEDGAQVSGVEGMESMGGMQGLGGPGGPPPPPPPGEGSDASSSDNDTSSTDAVLSSIQAFVENLRASMAAGSTYTTSRSSTASTTSGLIVDQLA